MKRFFYLGLATAMFFATSCSNDEFAGSNSAKNAQMTFSLDVDGVIGTRAAGEGANADMLVYSLFDAEGNLISTLPNANGGMVVANDAFASGNSESISLSLVKGQTYTINFWAQDSDCDAYQLTAEDGGLKVEVDYNGVNNDETRDAFYASETFTVEGDAELQVVLKRPFAQINLGVSTEDWNAALASGVNITSSKVVIKNAANTINLFDGSVSGETVVSYDFAAVPSIETRAASNIKDLTVNDQVYKWLSMSYILADMTKTTLDSDGLEFTLATDEGENIVLSEGLHNVPVQANWRTNVVGNVLTGEMKFNVSLDPIYYSTAVVGNVDEFYAALKDNNIQVIKLNAGVYDIMHVHTKGLKTIVSADEANPATIKGILAIGAHATIEFSNLNFDASSEKSLQKTGHQYIDRFERKSIVPIYAGKAKFTNCKFYDLYNSHNVVAINYQAHKAGVMLEIDNCYFEGFAYTIYSRTLISVTNSTFKQNHPDVAPRAIFLYGLGDGNNGKVIFKGNEAIGKTSYAIQMSSSNYDYRNINFDIQNNENFTGEKGQNTPYLFHPDRDYTGCSFAEGSETFEY